MGYEGYLLMGSSPGREMVGLGLFPGCTFSGKGHAKFLTLESAVL